MSMTTIVICISAALALAGVKFLMHKHAPSELEQNWQSLKAARCK